jgi:hypothetical protein
MGFERLLKPRMKKMICILKTKVFYKNDADHNFYYTLNDG